MKRFLRNPLAWVFLLSLLGIVASLLPWYRLSIFGSSSGITGYHLWQGKVAIGLFVAVSLLFEVFRPTPRRQAVCAIAAGIAIAGVAGYYICQIVFPAPTRIEVYEGGEVARAMAQGLVSNMHGHLSVGAPATLLLGLALAVVGVWLWRGTRAAQSTPEPPENHSPANQ